MEWIGKDADGFRSDWEGTYKTQLQNVANALKDAATKATKNAEEQESASNA